MSRYLQTSSNPFEDDEDERDFVTVGGKPQQTLQNNTPISNDSRATSSSSSGSQRFQNRSSDLYHSSYQDESSPFEDRHQKMMNQVQNSENNQLDSTQRALSSIYESEAMGVATAEELVRQGDTLNNIEDKTDNMQQTLKTSQSHLNNIKSVFGGIKNWWNGDKKAAQETKQTENANTRLRETIEKSEQTKPDVSGFYDDDDLDSKFMAGARKPGSVAGGYSMISPVTRSAREEEVDSNLVLMSEGMSRLKGLAAGLGDEIERQNDQLDRINPKVDRADELIGHQNVQMRKILK